MPVYGSGQAGQRLSLSSWGMVLSGVRSYTTPATAAGYQLQAKRCLRRHWRRGWSRRSMESVHDRALPGQRGLDWPRRRKRRRKRQDQSLARMHESGFRAGLSAKVDLSVNMDRVFGEQELDFMLFFSSFLSFVKPAGQSNYAAGCAFKDSFAQKLQQRRAYPVKIMNWGYWGKVGSVADESLNKAMERAGVGSIEPDEGMA